MKVHFIHPRTSKSFAAEVGDQLKIGQALVGLTGPFLPALQQGEQDEVILVRTQMVLPPDMTIAQAGVVDGDALQIRRSATGAQ